MTDWMADVSGSPGTDRWTVLLSIATVLLALATIGLAAATLGLVYFGRKAAQVAVEEVKTGRESLRAGLEQLQLTQIAERNDHKRRRGEATLGGIRLFEDRSRDHHAFLLEITRANTDRVKVDNPKAKPTQIKDLVRNHISPEVARELRLWLDQLELLAVGARYGLYDPRVVHRCSKTMIIFLWDTAAPFVSDFRHGDFDKRGTQGSAWENAQWLVELFPTLEGRANPEPLAGSLSLSD